MMAFRTLRDGELDLWAAHCAGVFAGPNDTVDYFRNHFLLDPHRDQNAVFIAEEDGEIASTLRVFRREVSVGGERIPMGGIGEVSTKPAYRKRGLSGELLKMAIEYMKREGLCTSLLFTGVNGHYARYGWFTHPIRSIALDAQLVPTLPEGDVLRPMQPGDVSAIRAMHVPYAAQFDGCIVREVEGYWTDWMTFAWNVPHVVVRNGAIVAYIDAQWDQERSLIGATDYAALPDAPPVESCLSALGAKLLWSGAIVMPAAMNPQPDGPFVENNGAMWRLNAPFTLHGERIDTPAKLVAALANTMFWRADGF